MLLLGLSAHAQVSETDSLKALVAGGSDDSIKVQRLVLLSKKLISNAPEEALIYANQARELSQQLNLPKDRALAYKTMGIVHYMQGNFIESIVNYEKSLAVFDSLGDKNGIANILSNEGAVYFNQADDAKALELYLKSLKVAEEINDTLRILTAAQNIGAVYFNKVATHNKALEYYLRALKLSQAMGDNDAIGTISVNIGEIYLTRGDDKSALKYLTTSLEALKGSEYLPYSLNMMARLYRFRKEYDQAIRYNQQALDISGALQVTVDMAQALLGLGDDYMLKKDIPRALSYYKRGEEISLQISKANYTLKDAYAGQAKAYAALRDYGNAFKYQSLLNDIKDSLYNIDTDKKLSGLQFNFDIQKKETEINLLTKDKDIRELDLKRQKIAKNALLGGLALAMFIAVIIYRNYRQKLKTNKILDSQKAEIEGLLLNILPAEVAQELQHTGVATPRYYERASVLFTDFKSFTALADVMSPQEVVTELNECFVAFDEIIGRYKLEKIKTIGDAYMCAGGLPQADPEHVEHIVNASLDIQHYIHTRNENRIAKGLQPWEIRIGIHTGPVVAGVVGRKKYAYDIWGRTVNIASRMESNGEPGKVNVSEATYEAIRDKYTCTYRGKISAKNIGEIDMYFVERQEVADVIIPVSDVLDRVPSAN
jgi:class 3 adenylate cyclase/Tfp pilus assembly protein PilF